MALRGTAFLSPGRTALAAASLLIALPLGAQYPGQVTRTSKDAPELRSIAVLEWTGEAGNPKASRLVPVAVLDGGQLQDGGIYLARPQPLALDSEVEYQLQQDGKPAGLFFAQSPGGKANLAEVLKQTLARFGGKGGGAHDFAQGGGLPEDQLEEALDFAESLLRVVS